MCMLILQIPLAYTLRKDILVIGLLLENSKTNRLITNRLDLLTYLYQIID
jgi:hypothetical protein